jgi:Tol biopolymer transport system component/DNA-binding winged helix-turn-helix (wHTH) protein
MNEHLPHFYEFGEYRLDAAKRLLWRGSETVVLMPKAFDVLLILVSQHGQIVTKDYLMEHVWHDSVVEENSLNVNVSALRRIFGEKPREHRFIATVPGVGYQFVADVNQVFNGHGAVSKNGDQPQPLITEQPVINNLNSLPVAKKTNKTWLWSTVSLALILITIAGYWFFYSKDEWSELPVIKRTIQITSSSALDFYPSISPDGNFVAFSSDRTGSFEIYVKQLVAGAREIQITSDGGQNFQPSFSSDGSLIAFHSKKRGGIWVIPATGGVAKQLTEFGTRPNWSPDSSQIAFQTSALSDLGFNAVNAMPPSTIWVVPARGGSEPKQLTEPGKPLGGHGSPVWSPDGKRILFCTNDLVETDLWSVSSEGGDLKKVLPGVMEAVYAPDGKSIFTTNGRFLAKIEVSENGDPVGEPVKMFEISSGPRIRQLSISAKSKKIVYTAISTVSNIWSTNLDPKTNEAASDPVQLTKSNTRNVTPSFSPDGKRITYQPSTVGLSGSIWIMDSDGSNQFQLVSGGSGFPWWFKDGKHLAFRTERDDKPGLWSTDVEGGKEKKLFDFEGDVSFIRLSPDGKKLAFNSKRDGSLNIWTSSIEGKEVKQLTFSKELMGFPAWSPDGKWIAFQIKTNESTNVAIIPSDGGEVTQLTFGKEQNWVYDWSPDGDKIIFAGERSGVWNVYWISRSTKQEKQLTNFTKINSYVRYPAWSPAGDKIAYEYAETTGNIWMMELK